MSAQPSDTTIEHVENKGSQNPEKAGFVRLSPSDVILGLKKTALNDLENGHETAKKIPGRHEAREKVGHPFAGRVGKAGL